MNDVFQGLIEKEAIITVLNNLFISTDNRDWERVKGKRR